MSPPPAAAPDATLSVATLLLELERSQRRLVECEKRMEQMEGVFFQAAEAIIVLEGDGQIVDVNPAASALLGYSRKEFLAMHSWDFATDATREEILATTRNAEAGTSSPVPRVCRSKDGEEKILALRSRRTELDGRDLIFVTGRDILQVPPAADLETALRCGTNTGIDDRRRTELLRTAEKRTLEMIADGAGLVDILNQLCGSIDIQVSPAVTTILLMDPDRKRLWASAGPLVPRAWTSAIGPVPVAREAGPCGIAAFLKARVIVTDVATDPNWPEQYRDLALRNAIRAAWSEPILTKEGEVLGTFAVYSSEPRAPAAADLALIEGGARIARIAIERQRSREVLHASDRLARGQTEALTRTLDALARETSPDRIAEHVLRTITTQLEAQSSSVWLRNEESGLMVFEFALEGGAFMTSADATIAAVCRSFRIEEIWPWPEVFRTGRPCLVEDIREGPDFPWRAHLLAQGIVAINLVPMLIAGRVAGVIGIRFTGKRPLRAEETELAQALANQAMLAIQLARLSAQSRRSAVLAERNRMAREIHDTLAQGFTGVIVQLEAAEEARAQDREALVSGHLARAGELARESLREARRSLRALRPEALEEKRLGEALRELIEKRTAGTTLQAKLTVQGESRDLPPEWESDLLRIGQEVLTNTLRHARAGKFDAQIAFESREIRLNLRDDGCGFDPAKRHEGFGLQGMRERAEGLGGHLSIQSAEGEGTMISVVLPFTTASAPARS